jgi:hypothetical protein
MPVPPQILRQKKVSQATQSGDSSPGPSNQESNPKPSTKESNKPDNNGTTKDQPTLEEFSEEQEAKEKLAKMQKREQDERDVMRFLEPWNGK